MARSHGARWLSIAVAVGLVGTSPDARGDTPAARVRSGRGPTPATSDEPWRRGTLAPTAAVGFAYAPDLISLQFGAGLDVYLAPGFALGLTVGDEIFRYSRQLLARLPRVDEQVPTNAFTVTARARYVFHRGRIFAPFVFAGLGPTVLNHGNGTVAHWTAGPGAYIRLTGPVWLDLGMDFSGMFPLRRCNDLFEYRPAQGAAVAAVDDVCAFGWGPRLGIAIALGRARARRRGM